MELKEEKILVSGREVTIRGLDTVLREVAFLNMGDEQTQREIMKRVKFYNYIPKELEDDIREILWRMFLEKYRGGKENSQ
ncbi:MAG: hypothetical protein J7L88_03660 [Thermoplasmata archaeon]|nr:hypothetical protein [Thermoplasmata archaeon]